MDLPHLRTLGRWQAQLSGHPDAIIAGGFLAGNRLLSERRDPGGNDYRWLLLLDGSGAAIDEHGVRHDLGPGSLFIRAPHTPHRIMRTQDGTWLEFFLRLPLALHRALVELGAIDPAQRIATCPVTDGLVSALEAFVTQLADSTQAGQEARAIAAASSLLATMSQRTAPRPDAVDRVRQQLDAKPVNAASIASLAAEAGLSNDALRAAFHRRFGCTPKAYHIRARVAAAQALLLSGASVASTAEQLGYPDPFCFSKQFRRVVGIPPSRFRNA
ncbi:MAG: AraC family transcriptional regulator [Planctomycetota bacterium]|jgi:AraC-like DNA-binding protein|nr:AraC family transcriptional regulator [Planctomycetota bacterium]